MNILIPNVLNGEYSSVPSLTVHSIVTITLHITLFIVHYARSRAESQVGGKLLSIHYIQRQVDVAECEAAIQSWVDLLMFLTCLSFALVVYDLIRTH